MQTCFVVILCSAEKVDSVEYGNDGTITDGSSAVETADTETELVTLLSIFTPSLTFSSSSQWLESTLGPTAY